MYTLSRHTQENSHFGSKYSISKGLVKMGELSTVSSSPALDLPAAQQNQGLAIKISRESKPKKNICCACPDTRKLRDECIVEHGEEACVKWIEAHRKCLHAEGFNV
ncbi:hypothetical protein I3760_11G163600 [Carya illinoinensis]|uniref:cytochrome c oxidase copper chaperone 2-like isoform X2 n=1 Tax=Carya illinoinensis TaxID=32201 RepID=UPI001BF8CC99|nr:cytochrome c oxidase copper chaperone 2-like isoform X2 [Carya illinoinensis]KAG2681863.1 hypothetical protein I3760_11G163600 [Carya illinoinensis]